MSIDSAVLAAACLSALATSHFLVFRRPKRLVVQTQRGIPAYKPPIPANPCRKCGGTGKTICGNCNGVGRVNHMDRAMLPKGVPPQWCQYCRASGRWYCERCMGTGQRRDPIGFRLGADSDE